MSYMADHAEIGAVYFFEYRAAMDVLSTAITAMMIAIKTAAVGQSMAYLPSHDRDALKRRCVVDAIWRNRRSSRVIGPML